MLVEAFAKINWSLDITGVREDGYHLMDMLMQPVSLADDLTLTPARELSLTASGFPPVRADRSNLIWRAADALKQAAGYPGGAAIHVFKRIPVGAGLGGGSADAAGVLRGLNQLWQTGLSEAELEKIGLTLGADVPFCLRGGLTRTRGIGEEMESLPVNVNYWLVVVQPCRGLSTREIFTAYHSSFSEKHPNTTDVLKALAEGNTVLLSDSVYNVLEPVSSVRCPEIADAVRALSNAGAFSARMTGSGSAVFGVFRSRTFAQKALSDLSARYKNIYLCHTQNDSIRIQED